MNLANRITILRILLVPVFIILMIQFKNTGEDIYRKLSIVVFSFAALTDALDGFLARTRNMQTELGAMLDPIADKFLLISAVFILSTKLPLPRTIPIWFTVLVISRDVLIFVGIAVIDYIKGQIDIQPSLLSKMTTCSQILTVIWVMLLLPQPQIIWYTSAALTLLSAMGYIREGNRIMEAGH
jgi:cardiolipin synthase (CMP-forming)